MTGKKVVAATPTFAEMLAQAQTELDRIRDEVVQLRIELEEVERRPVDQAEIERRVDGAVTALAAEARRELPGGYFLGRRPSSLDFLTQAKIPSLALASLIWPGPLRAALLSVAGAAADVAPEGISEADRLHSIAELQGRVLELERAEVAKLWAIEDAGMPAPWRPDLPPTIVLDLDPAPEPAP